MIEWLHQQAKEQRMRRWWIRHAVRTSSAMTRPAIQAKLPRAPAVVWWIFRTMTLGQPTRNSPTSAGEFSGMDFVQKTLDHSRNHANVW